MIVGAGPVGSYLAYRLARLGHKVVVFERRSKVGDAVHCTGIIGKECFDRFPVSNSAILTHLSSAKFFAPSGKYLRLCKETVQAFVVDRIAFDCDLAHKAQAEGAEYLLSTRVEDIAILDDRVKTEVVHGGKTSNFEGKVVVISSGFGVSLPQRLGLGKISSGW